MNLQFTHAYTYLQKDITSTNQISEALTHLTKQLTKQNKNVLVSMHVLSLISLTRPQWYQRNKY